MRSNFYTQFIREPDLIFGNQGHDPDPRIGLNRYGPYFYRDESTPLESVRIGIIGDRIGIESAKKILEFVQSGVKSPKNNRWLYPDFPGASKRSPFKCNFITSNNWNAKLTEEFDLKPIPEIHDDNLRIAQGVKIFVDKIEEIHGNDDQPNVIICVLPKSIEQWCGISEKTRGAKRTKLTPEEKRQRKFDKKREEKQLLSLQEWGFTPPVFKPKELPKSYDFRNSLKGKVMQYGIPIQILHQTTCNEILDYKKISKHKKQDPSSFCWNFSTALYYKANGKPWRLAKLNTDTCYVGISFFIDKLHPSRDTQISMAQVFTENGEGLVLRGTEVDIDKFSKQAYLREDQAKKLLLDALEKYENRTNHPPKRVVIHKTSVFSEKEQNGFKNALFEKSIRRHDFVTIKTASHGLRFLRMGIYPPLRGTLIELSENEFLLYSSGFSPRLRTYAGHRIPNPLRIIHHGTSEKFDIAKEILGLTKLNWNTTSFSTFLPITISFAKEVGNILSEFPEEEQDKIRDHYRFFM